MPLMQSDSLVPEYADSLAPFLLILDHVRTMRQTLPLPHRPVFRNPFIDHVDCKVQFFPAGFGVEPMLYIRSAFL